MDNPQVHHIIPQVSLENPKYNQLLDDLEINIHDPKYLSYWNSPNHQVNVPEYQRRIEALLNKAADGSWDRNKFLKELDREIQDFTSDDFGGINPYLYIN